METIQLVIKKLHAYAPPKEIWQQPYEHKGKAYKRLCNLNGGKPREVDLYDYVMDLAYEQSRIQPDLFTYLLPVLLSAWREALLGRAPRDYAAFEELFFPALIKQGALYKILEPEQFDAVQDFVVQAILERIGEEKSLHNVGSLSPAYSWFHALSAFSIVFPNLSELWAIWWSMLTDGHAIAVLQYVSCLMCEDEANPLFSPWTAAGGGGPPNLNESGCHFYECGWRPENVDFIKNTLLLEYIEKGLRTAVSRLEGYSAHTAIYSRLLADWPDHINLLKYRLEQLPELLSNIDLLDWPVL